MYACKTYKRSIYYNYRNEAQNIETGKGEEKWIQD